jgi:Zn-dependent peptidase ImmA (M78 family)/transcriptional regulator with XRE-family HTH domain
MNELEVNRQMIVLARESRGFTQQELADALGVNQSYICKIESGLLNVSAEYLEKIATTLKYPTEFFCQPDEVRGVGSACNYHRKRESLARRDWYQITARLNILRLHASKLLRGVKTEHENRFHYLDCDEFPCPEEAAMLIRHYWKLPNGPVMNLVGEIENAGGIVYLLPFGTDKLDAISQSVQGSPPLFLVNSEIPGDRLRFTLAHELGHIIMHSRSPSEEAERDADRFAAAFLMPEDDISDDLEDISIKKAASVLKPYWKVAISALLRRAKDLEKITPNQYVNFCKQLSYYGYRKREPVDIPLEKPTVLKETIDVYLSEYRYGFDELAKLLHLHESEVQSEFGSDRSTYPNLRIV